MSIIPMVDLLADKRNVTQEIHLILFEHCNLSCSFCHQDHDSIVGMDSIVSKTLDTVSTLDPDVEYKINVTGGELFHDGVPDKVFDDYYTAITMLLEDLPKSKVYLGTNLVYDPTRLKDLMGKLKLGEYGDRVTVTTSYDPAGRFNAKQEDIFWDNLKDPDIMGYVTSVNVVITKQNIDSIINNKCKDKLDYLYKHFDVYFDHFIANNSYDLFQPSEERITEFFLYIKDHYPLSGPINEMMSGNDTKLTCQSTIIFTDDGQKVTCWGEAGKDRTMDYEEGLRRKSAAEQDFLDHYGCLSCEYYRRCTMRCFLHHRSLDERPEECQIKLLYDAL